MPPADAYAALMNRSKDLTLLRSCAGVLDWDQQTYMPRAGAALRGDQLAYLAGLAHKLATDPAFGELLGTVEGSPVVADPSSVEAANVREWRHGFDRATKLPGRLVEELARVTAHAQQTWADARKRDHFPTFLPCLEKILTLKHEEADAVGYTAHRYDALLDEYEPGTTAADVSKLFAELSAEVAPLVQSIADSGVTPRSEILHREYPIDRQRLFAEGAAAALGYDFSAGRLDVSGHPFSSGFGPGDSRITTRFN
ncbi:MAG: carboxypeptidase M32, partial [Fimbriiglobus sp.]